MQTTTTKPEIQNELAQQRAQKKSIGFVPTMGALHHGHISLVEKSKSENDFTVVSIFVNPSQFNNPLDLKNYPRTLETDLEKLKAAGVDLTFIPSVNEMYPDNETQIDNYDFGELEKVMEGKHRPGHFKGVAQVVSKLFKIVEPHKAYFGEKDFQQLAIIRALIRKMNSGIKIIPCQTIREPSGLAMSSRNMLLTKEERNEAAKISKALSFIRDNHEIFSLEEIIAQATKMIEESGVMKVEYLEIADAENLASVKDWSNNNPLRVFTATQLGKVRLIDNVALEIMSNVE